MFNLLSYIGMSLQSELCLWTLLGLVRTIFDATLFKVNANLKQVWQMNMPAELSMPVQRVLRTMISGVMLVQCFTVYVYLASYIVLLYPIFLEERPTLVLPWLLLAAIRKFLCELTSLALGLGTCMLVGPARPSCIKFVIIKLASITPAFYMWMLVYSYYNTLKVASAFKTFPAAIQSSDHDYGLELAVRRRRTKSLQDEAQLRKKLVANFSYGARTPAAADEITIPRVITEIHPVRYMETKSEVSSKVDMEIIHPLSVTSEKHMSDIGYFEDWYVTDVIPRDTDRILEQFVMMMLRIGAYIKAEGNNNTIKMFNSNSQTKSPHNNLECRVPGEYTETPPQVGNSKARTASYLQEYPQIFMKKNTDTLQLPAEQMFDTTVPINSQAGNEDTNKVIRSNKLKTVKPEENTNLENDNAVNFRQSSKINNTSSTEKINHEQALDGSNQNLKNTQLNFLCATEQGNDVNGYDIKSVSGDNYSLRSEHIKLRDSSNMDQRNMKNMPRARNDSDTNHVFKIKEQTDITKNAFTVEPLDDQIYEYIRDQTKDGLIQGVQQTANKEIVEPSTSHADESAKRDLETQDVKNLTDTLNSASVNSNKSSSLNLCKKDSNNNRKQ